MILDTLFYANMFWRNQRRQTSAHRTPWIFMLGYPRYRNYPWI